VKRAFRIAAVVAGSLAVVFVAGGMLLPRVVTVERKTWIDATASEVYPLVASFKNGWIHWDPFRDKPNQTVTHRGPEEGVGAEVHWDSPKKRSSGSLRMTEAVPGERVAWQLEMPAKFSSRGQLVLAAQAGGTTVTWTDHFTMHDSLLMRWIGLAVGPGVGKRYDAGLADLKAYVESRKRAVTAPVTTGR
jgi:hypothetical protein